MEKIICGDSLQELKKLEDNSIDSVVTDPPYEIGFMGKGWDSTGIAYNIDLWKEVLRVLKPGGYLLAFGGSRTYHRMACAVEDAGFEIRDMIEWIYGSGFPKSLNIGKQIDKLQGNERKIIGRNPNSRENCDKTNTLYRSGTVGKTDYITKGNSPYEGWGTALKPAHEPLVWAIKPLTFNDNFDILKEINNNLSLIIWQSLNELQKMDISKLQEMVSIHLNIVLLWQSILEELLKKENKSIISMESKPIIELKILNYLLLKNTPENTDEEYQIFLNEIQEFQVNGLNYLALIAKKSFWEENQNIDCTLNAIVQELAIWKQKENGIFAKNAIKNLPAIIPIVNSVLLNVLTYLITEKNKKELSIIVNFAENNLKQYLVGNQNIVDGNVWQKHLDIIPNHSPICMARKPLSEKSVVDNVLKWGTGGINIDGCRIESNEELGRNNHTNPYGGRCLHESKTPGQNNIGMVNGRFPANLIHDGSDEVVKLFPNTKPTKPHCGDDNKLDTQNMGWGFRRMPSALSDNGGPAARFFYCAKASKSERNKGLNNIKCSHPTVKPISLMRYLCRLVTPKGGTVLDPFMGSGSTGIAAKLEGFNFIGIEIDPEYVSIANARIAGWEPEPEQKPLIK